MKYFKVAYYILVGLLALIAIVLIISVFPITGNFKILTVLSGSMEPKIHIGSIVFVKPSSDYKIGDVITFGPNTKTQTPVTHRISDMRVVDGNIIYVTKGDANDSPDIREIQKKDIIGKVLFSVPFAGYAVDYAKKPFGFVLIIAIPAILIVYDEIRKIWKEIMKLKSKKKDSEQDEEISRLKEEVDKFKKSKQ